MIKDDIVFEFSPITATLAIGDSQFIKKFYNDIVCIEHLKKESSPL